MPRGGGTWWCVLLAACNSVIPGGCGGQVADTGAPDAAADGGMSPDDSASDATPGDSEAEADDSGVRLFAYSVFDAAFSPPLDRLVILAGDATLHLVDPASMSDTVPMTADLWSIDDALPAGTMAVIGGSSTDMCAVVDVYDEATLTLQRTLPLPTYGTYNEMETSSMLGLLVFHDAAGTLFALVKEQPVPSPIGILRL